MLARLALVRHAGRIVGNRAGTAARGGHGVVAPARARRRRPYGAGTVGAIPPWSPPAGTTARGGHDGAAPTARELSGRSLRGRPRRARRRGAGTEAPPLRRGNCRGDPSAVAPWMAGTEAPPVLTIDVARSLQKTGKPCRIPADTGRLDTSPSCQTAAIGIHDDLSFLQGSDIVASTKLPGRKRNTQPLLARSRAGGGCVLCSPYKDLIDPSVGIHNQ